MSQSEADKRWEKELRAVGLAVERFERHTAEGLAPGPELTEVRFMLEADEGTSVLAVLKARGEGGKLVGFVGGSSLVSTILSAAKRLTADTVRWREDRPYGDR